MIKKAISVTGLAILLIAISALTACGSGSESSASTAGADITEAETTTAEPTSAEIDITERLPYVSDEAYGVIMSNSSPSKWKRDGEIVFAINIFDDEWAKLQNHDEMVLACQIPEDLLEEISTPDLVKLVGEYPLLNSDMYLQDGLKEGFRYVCNTFNGLRALLEREDCAEAVYSEYIKIEIPQNSVLEFGKQNTEEEEVAYVNKILNDENLMKISREELHPFVLSNLYECILRQKMDVTNRELFTAAISEKQQQKSTSEIDFPW